MPPRLPFTSLLVRPLRHEVQICRRYATAAAAASTVNSRSPINSSPSISAAAPISVAAQPPTHRRAEYRKSQLLREYTALLRTSPLILIFQHHNLQSVEWAAIRRELNKALANVDDTYAAQGRTDPPLASSVKLQIIQTSIFEIALRIVDFYRPEGSKNGAATNDPSLAGTREDPTLTHDLSRNAYASVLPHRGKHEFSDILMGPIAVLALPSVAPEYIKAALTILSPKAPAFPAPTRRANPGYHDLKVQMGLQKLSLLAARVEGKLFDVDETRWVGGIEGGMAGLRSQLVSMLQGVGASVTTTLEGASKSLYVTMESRRSAMEEEEKGPEGKESEQSEQSEQK